MPSVSIDVDGKHGKWKGFDVSEPRTATMKGNVPSYLPDVTDEWAVLRNLVRTSAHIWQVVLSRNMDGQEKYIPGLVRITSISAWIRLK